MAQIRKITNAKELRQAMSDLEKKVKFQEADIKSDFIEVKENLRPKKLVKNTFSYLAETPEIQRTLVNTVFGFILGYASKKAAELLTEKSLDRTVENFVNHHVARLEDTRPKGLLSKGVALIRKHTPPTSPIYPFVRYK